MRKGCAIGCLVVVAALAIIVILVAFFVFRSSAPVPVADSVSAHSAAVLAIDPNAPELLGPIGEGLEAPPEVVGYLLPYEAGVIVDVEPERSARVVKLAVSPRRFRFVWSFLLEAMAEDTSSFGIADWGRDDWTLKGTQAIAPESLELAKERWPEPSQGALEFEGGHVVELVLDNRDGRAFLALEGLIVPPNESEQGDEEKQQVFDAQQLSSLLYRISTAHVTADFADEDTLAILVRAECPDEIAAETTVFALLTLRDYLFRQAIEQGMVIEGEPVQEGSAIRGEFTLTGFREPLARKMAELKAEHQGEGS